MVDYITLLGAEQVQSAANQMRSAADQIQSAASSMQWAFEQHQRFLENWLAELREALESKKVGS